MKTSVAIVGVIILLGGLWIWGHSSKESPSPVTETPTETPTGEPQVNDIIHVFNPQPGAVVKSPLTITGEARGYWYFEASFPVRVLDANGKILAEGPAQAKTDWMTEDFVQFETTLSFTPTTGAGTLVLHNDNPSGLPENDREIRIPISFGSTTVPTRNVKLYFYDVNKDKNAAGDVLCSAQGLTVIERAIPFGNTPIQDAVRELLKGPLPSEKAGLTGTEFPLPGLALNSASLSGTALTMNFSDPQNKTSGGSCRVTVLKAQIEATAKQFGGVGSVKFAPASLFQP